MSARGTRRKLKRGAVERPPREAPAVPARHSTWTLRSMAAVLTLLGIVPMANIVSTGQGLPWWGAAARDWIGASLAVVALALVLARLLPQQVDTLQTRAMRLLLAPSSRTFNIGTALLAALIALGFGWYLFHWLPITGDEFSQQWQSHLLTHGRLFAHSEARSEFFSTAETLNHAGRWFSQFPVGGPAIMSIGFAARAPWLVNPLLSGVAVAGFYRFVTVADEERSARVATLLLALCPFFLFMGGSEMNHTATLACLTTALAALASWHASEDGTHASKAAAVLGGVIGLAATIRPYDAAIVGSVIGVFQLLTAWRRPELRRSLIVQAIVGCVPIAALLASNRATVGAPLTFAYDVLHGAEHRPGFHLTPLGFEHTPRRGLYIISAYLLKLNAGLLAWPIPAIPIVAGAMLLQRKESRWDRLLVGILAALLVGYAVYWGESYFVGPRYLFLAVPGLLVYVARFPSALRDRLGSPTLRAASSLLVPICLAIAWLSPPMESRISGVWGLAEPNRMKGSEAGLLHADARRNVPPRSLVFIDDGWHARLAARLRLIGARPLMAERMVSSTDACTIQSALDEAELSAPNDPNRRVEIVLARVEREQPSVPVAGLTSANQLAFVPGRSLSEQCQRELGRPTVGVTMDEILPYEPITSNGVLDGPIVYARDFGTRNELLRPRFGDRGWFVAHRREFQGRVEFRFVPYQPPER